MPPIAAQLQPFCSNTLDAAVDDAPVLTGIIGDHPSTYSRSPAIWNAAFRAIGLDATYVPFDIAMKDKLEGFVRALRSTPTFIGCNVTMPYKEAVIPLLDDIDADAKLIGAVNTVRRDADGRLTGYNTDAIGALKSLTERLPWQKEPFMETVYGHNILLIGAGGAGRAVAFGLAREMGPMTETKALLRIVSRTFEHARDLVRDVNRAYKNARVFEEHESVEILSYAHLIVNASIRGQSGWSALPGGKVTSYELFSALAPANPIAIDPAQYPVEADRWRAWFNGSWEKIMANNDVSASLMRDANPDLRAFDLVYSPPETTMLQHARLTGHPTINGKGMIIFQAVEAFANKIVGPYLESKGKTAAGLYATVLPIMANAWGTP